MLRMKVTLIVKGRAWMTKVIELGFTNTSTRVTFNLEGKSGTKLINKKKSKRKSKAESILYS